MYCGVALFLVGHVAFTFRVEQIVKVRRLVAAAVMLALIPLGLQLPALGALALLVAVMVLLILVETIRFAEARERIRHEED
jgi:uncharacterized membrane protein YhhN